MYIAVAGNIGCGKTTLVEMLSEKYGWKPYYENIDNPYLDDFYKDMKLWSFKLQISFMANKVVQMRDIAKENISVIQDRTIFEEAMVFVKNLHNMTLLTYRDYKTYIKIYNLLIEEVKHPDLLIFLKADVSRLISQINKRGRAFEQNIQTEYLQKLNELYLDWIENIYEGEKLIIDIDKLDFVDNASDNQKIVEIIESKIKTLGLK